VQEGGVPIWIAGRIRRSIVRAARHQGWYASTPVRLDEIEAFAAMYREELEKLGKDPASARVGVNRIFVVGESDADVEPWASNLLRTYAGLGALRTPDGVTRRPDEDLFRIFGDEIYLAGTPEQVLESIRRYEAAGVTDLNVRLLGGRAPIEVGRRTLELFRDEIRPRL
jgi:alkanesulfonate monooxygenase SsuD/methylene tetrahydromethanopterin reductase-like flavin-dependent oxidoreductase (luciferase family)